MPYKNSVFARYGRAAGSRMRRVVVDRPLRASTLRLPVWCRQRRLLPSKRPAGNSPLAQKLPAYPPWARRLCCWDRRPFRCPLFSTYPNGTAKARQLPRAAQSAQTTYGAGFSLRWPLAAPAWQGGGIPACSPGQMT
jgi:hypothetical protein